MDRRENALIYPPDHELHKQSIYDSLRFFLVGESRIIIRKVVETIPEIKELEA